MRLCIFPIFSLACVHSRTRLYLFINVLKLPQSQSFAERRQFDACLSCFLWVLESVFTVGVTRTSSTRVLSFPTLFCLLSHQRHTRGCLPADLCSGHCCNLKCCSFCHTAVLECSLLLCFMTVQEDTVDTFFTTLSLISKQLKKTYLSFQNLPSFNNVKSLVTVYLAILLCLLTHSSVYWSEKTACCM